MSYADKVFKANCIDILENGTDTQGQKVRPHWEDGTPAYTIKKFCIVNRYDLRKEFPAMTLRPVGIKTATDEILWIWQKKSNKLADLHSHIWDQWKDDKNEIGTAYGYTAGEPFMFKGKWTDQTDYVRYLLKNEPFSRRIMTNLYQFKNLATGRLDPCAYSVTFNVTDDKRPDGKLTLNMILKQRSQDMMVANGWNVCQYAIFGMMLAQEAGMVMGEFVHVIEDAHIYDRHVPLIKEMLTREEYPAPEVSLNPNITNFYDFTPDDVIVKNYVCGEQIKNIPVAI